MDAIRLIETPVIYTGNTCPEELDQLWAEMEQRQALTRKLLDGAIDWEFYFDFMAQSGIEPEELIDTAQQNLDFAIAQGIPIEL